MTRAIAAPLDPRASRRRLSRAALILAAAAALAGCSGARSSVGSALGLNYTSPDAFNVSPRAPLRLPGDLSALPPPQPGAASPLDPQPQRTARAALSGAGTGAAGAAAPSPGELALLDASGAETADPAIRETLAAENAAPRERRFGLSSLFGYEIGDGTEAEALEAREEADRIRASGGVTPTPAPVADTGPTGEYELPLSF